MLLISTLTTFYCISLICVSICNKLIISDLCILFPDAKMLKYIPQHLIRRNLSYDIR